MAKGLGSMLEVARIQSEINRLFDNLLVDAGGEESGSWIPLADIVESDEALAVTIELPGVAAGDLAIATHGGDVILTGSKSRPEATDPATRAHVAERAYGRFRRVIHLGVPVNTHKAEAVLADGTLRIKFPKVPNRRGEEVVIQVTTA